MGQKVDVRKLEVFNRVSKEGARTVAGSLNQMAGLETEIQVAKINILHEEDVRTHLGDEEKVGIYVELTDPPHGYVLFLLDPDDSKQLAQSMLPGGGGGDGDGFTDMERSALQEIGNIMTSGYIDGWANVLDTTIDMTTPTFSFGPSNGIVDQMGGWPDEEIVFVLDSVISANETDVNLTVYTFPELDPLVGLVQAIDVETDIKEDTVADDLL